MKSPFLSFCVIIGARGTGKTALLSCLGTEAKQRDWVVVDSVAREGTLVIASSSLGSILFRLTRCEQVVLSGFPAPW